MAGSAGPLPPSPLHFGGGGAIYSAAVWRDMIISHAINLSAKPGDALGA